MTMTREMLDQFSRILRPLQTRIANSIARAVVQLVDDGKKLQLLQLGVLQGEDIDDAERFQSYGFSSVPLAGAEAVVIFPGGDRAHPLVVAVDDRRYRPTGGQPGEVTVYHHTGAKIRLEADGDIEVQPAPGRQVFIRSEGGSAEPLVKKSEFDAHIHPAPGGATSTPAAIIGTTALEAE
jgi:phage gp45-like